MACELHPGTCRRKHIAPRLEDAEPDGDDWKARCPLCGHDAFRLSGPTRSRSYRNIFTCACRHCRGRESDIRAALLGPKKIDVACLGNYDGAANVGIPPEIAYRQNLAIRDILAVPHLKPADIRIALAEAIGRAIPDDYTEFVKFAKDAGVGHQQAYEAARRWIRRPSDSRPRTRGAVVDTSHNTEPENVVKSHSSQPREATETVELPYGNRMESQENRPTVSVEPANQDKPIKPAA